MSTVTRQPEMITAEGRSRLRLELQRLVTARTRLATELREMRGASGHDEESSVAAALEDHATISRRIEELESTLTVARVIAPRADGVAALGEHVSIRLDGAAAPLRCRLVPAIEADPAAMAISTESPIGQALLGRRAGDVVRVETPSGVRLVEVTAVGGLEHEAA
jgi:transcription elongation factor GreA